jgi:molecular chaperone DnaJ
MINYYDVLCISNKASAEEVKKAFRKLIKNYHPDVAQGKDNKKLMLVMKAYEVLSNEYERNLYDYEFYTKNRTTPEGLILLSPKRVKYTGDIKSLFEKGLLRKKLKKQDYKYHFTHDIDIFLTVSESLSGCKAIFELPVRKLCPYCRGNERTCYFCHGIGRINSVHPFEIIINSEAENGSIIEVDLLKDAKIPFVYFKMSKVRIKINILGKSCAK